MEQTQRLKHRIGLLLLSPNWREMPWAERVLLWERLEVAPAYATLDDEARSNLHWSAWECAKDEAELEFEFTDEAGLVINLLGNWDLLEPAGDADATEDFVERALDTVGVPPESWSDEMADEEARYLARAKAPKPKRPRRLRGLKPGDFLICPKGILHGALPFNTLQVLRAHADGTVDVFLNDDLFPETTEQIASVLPVFANIPPSEEVFLTYGHAPLPPEIFKIPTTEPTRSGRGGTH